MSGPADDIGTVGEKVRREIANLLSDKMPGIDVVSVDAGDESLSDELHAALLDLEAAAERADALATKIDVATMRMDFKTRRLDAALEKKGKALDKLAAPLDGERWP